MHLANGGFYPLNQNHIRSLRNIQRWYARNRSDTSIFDYFRLFRKDLKQRFPSADSNFLRTKCSSVKNLPENFPRISTVQPPNLFQQQRCSFSSGRIDVLPMSIKVHSLLWGVRHPTNVVPKSSSAKFRKCGLP